MASEAKVYYELSLVLSDNDDFNTVVTYYNGGAEPPYGGVKALEQLEDSDLTIEQASFLLDSVDGWVNRVIEIMRPGTKMTKCASPDLDMKTKMWMDGDELKLKIASETLDANFVYDPTDRTIVMKARPAFDLSWCGFLYYHETLKRYLCKIKD